MHLIEAWLGIVVKGHTRSYCFDAIMQSGKSGERVHWGCEY